MAEMTVEVVVKPDNVMAIVKERDELRALLARVMEATRTNVGEDAVERVEVMFSRAEAVFSRSATFKRE